MRRTGRGRLRRGVLGFVIVLGIGALVGSAALPRAAAAQSGEEGNVCVQDLSENTHCTASEILASDLVLVNVVESCPAGDPTTATVVLDLVVAGGAATRYDVALFLALGGGSALSGNLCFHDFLEPPLQTNPVYGDSNGNAVPDLRNGPWDDLEPFVTPEDRCGDLPGGTEAIKSLASPSVPLVIDCVDANQDGTVDVDVCVGWRNGTQGSCRNLNDAIAEASNRCSCTRLEIAGLPEPSSTAALGAGAIAVLLCAVHRRRRIH